MSNPEDAVLAAIDGLELDEVGQIVKWQLEEGMARGEHIADPWTHIAPPPPDHSAPADVPGNRWRTWDENWNLVTETSARPTTWTEGHWLTVDREGEPRWSGRVVDGRPMRDIELIHRMAAWANPFLPAVIDAGRLYRECEELAPGNRVGYQDEGGTIHIGVVESHEEVPPGSGRWEIRIGGEDADPIARVGDLLQSAVDLAESITDGEAER